MAEIKLEKSWKKVLQAEFTKPYIQQLRSFIQSEIEQGKTVYPHGSEVFTALNTTPFDQVKVVIVGQDPYHGPDQAHGLCFSVKPGVRPPPSLVNIYKELKSDLGYEPVNHGYLISWAQEGVLLLNTVLTVEKGKAGSHRGKGWEQFTDAIINKLNQEKAGLVFILWGQDARSKGASVDRSKHLVLESAHPSPFSVQKFYGGKHFSKTNDYLTAQHKTPINWQLPT